MAPSERWRRYMSQICPELKLNPKEEAILSVNDTEVETWLDHAQKGDLEMRDSLLAWAYTTARNYYCWNVIKESKLRPDNADDLTGQFFSTFEKQLPNLRSAVAFTRQMLPATLRRFFLNEQKHKQFENLDPSVLTTEPDHPWERWDDEQLIRYKTVLEVLKEADEVTTYIIKSRLEDPPEKAPQIAKKLDMQPDAVRQRRSRFYNEVRQRLKRRSQRN